MGTTPLEISIAIHYCCRTDDYGDGNGDKNFSAPAVQEAIARFMAAGLLKENKGTSKPYFTADRDALGTYVQALCDVPLPVQKWVVQLKLVTT